MEQGYEIFRRSVVFDTQKILGHTYRLRGLDQPPPCLYLCRETGHVIRSRKHRKVVGNLDIFSVPTFIQEESRCDGSIANDMERVDHIIETELYRLLDQFVL